jgi:sialidase-1
MRGKSYFLLVNVLIVVLSLYSCSKDSSMKPDYTLSVVDREITMRDGVSGGSRITDAVILKQDAMKPDAANPGGYAYSSVMKYPNGVYVIASMGHPGFFHDFYPGVISYKKSYDSGRTWTPTLLMQENIGIQNVMHPTVLAMNSGSMMSLFLVKNSKTDLNIVCKETSDTGVTWSSIVDVGTPHEGYKVIMNGRLTKLSSGRLIVPVAFMKDIDGPQDVQLIYCYISDDDGQTWIKTNSYGSRVMMQEPGITELADGTLLMCIRSNQGTVLFSTSHDQGMSWETIQRSKIHTPEAPETIIYSPKHQALFMVWNDAVYNPALFLNRSTLSIAVSRDNGATWTKVGDLENDEESLFFYPALMIDKDELIVTYSKYKKAVHLPSIVFERLDINKLIN